MRIDQALPMDRYAKAIAHSRTSEYKSLKSRTLNRLREWYQDDRINKNIYPALWSSYGKDSMAVAILLKVAKLPFINLCIKNDGEVDRHWEVINEFHSYMESNFDSAEFYYEIYQTQKPLPHILKFHINWGNEYGFTNKDGTKLDFWNHEPVKGAIAYEAIYQFHDIYAYEGYTPGCGQFNVLEMWGSRKSEGMEKAFEIAKKGILQFLDQSHHGVDGKFIPKVRGLPIADWRDIDVWALLCEYYCPVSPLYSMHQIPQQKGARAFPRTLAICTPDVLSAQYFKWACRYAPSQIRELCTLFPEVPQRFGVKLKSK